MEARVPQDVDLEDRLIYGLTPLRFGYLVIAVLGGLSLWRFDVLPAWLRILPCLLLVGCAGALAWGRWQGRGLDRWLADLAVHVCRNYRVGLARPARPRPVAIAPRSVVVPLRAIRAASAPGLGVRPEGDGGATDLPPAA
jgi:hypothetical protein